MNLYSKQIIYCNNCGAQMNVAIPQAIGTTFKVCSMECLREYKWKETLSIMNQEYYPRVIKEDEK
jgi:hypothetical protein